MYVTEVQSPQKGQGLVVRTGVDPSAMQLSIQRAVREIDKDQILDYVKTLDQVKADSVGGERLRSLLLGIFAGVALLLSAIGLYGVISYSVLQRTREIGIRTALGATSSNILGLVLKNGLTLTAIGLLIGLAGAFGFSQVLASMLFKVGKYDPITLAVVFGLLASIALLACFFPARRAARVNPLVALRDE